MSDDSEIPPEVSPTGDSILASIGRRTGRTPRTSLHDAESDDGSPIVDPRAGSFEDQLRGRDRAKYRVVGEIASGGMGVVLRGHDSELGRDVAMKVVHAELAERPEVVERFVEEAQIGGQLQHPGIVPVYELGLMADERPYFTMKLVKGHTLAKLIARRSAPEDDRAGFLAIFESVCQTMAYAHSKGVVHRDLKPANVMVGGFGEVQVVDWGLSKVLARGGVDDELAAQDAARSVIETIRSGPRAGSESQVGSVLGTPAYMAPEQARGDATGVDERADVFALGAILCELLTGAPPYVAGEGRSLVQMAALADLEEARARLAACAAPDALVELCNACLMPAPVARPATAREVADAVRAHLAGLENAAHEAQLAAAEQRVTAERSRRQMQAALGTAALALVIGGGLWWTTSQRQTRQARLAEGFADARQIALDREQQGAHAQAVDAARAGLALLESRDADEELLAKARALVERTEAALKDARMAEVARERDRRLLEFLDDAAMRAVDPDLNEEEREMDEAYRAAFRDYGLELSVTGDDLTERIDELRGTPMGLSIALGVEGWTHVLREMAQNRSEDVDLLTSIALDLDDDPLRTEIRLASAGVDRDGLVALVDEVLGSDSPPETMVLLASSLARVGASAEARAVYIAAAERYPGDFIANYGAGATLRQDEATRGHRRVAEYLRAAIALRPDLATTYVEIGNHYRDIGNAVLAARYAERGTELAPRASWNAMVLGNDWLAVGDFERATEWYEREMERYGPSILIETLLQGSRTAAGEITVDEYVAWCDERLGESPTAAFGPAYVLTTRRAGQSYDPSRALDLLQPFLDGDLDDVLGWMTVARARVGVGDGAGALDALRRTEDRLPPFDMSAQAIHSLLVAAALRLEGRDAEADAELAEARRHRDALTADEPAAWSESTLLDVFRTFEPIAAGT